MPVPQGNYGGGQPSCFDRMKMGFMMGMVVGMCSGLHSSHSNVSILTKPKTPHLRCHIWWGGRPEDGDERGRAGAECGQDHGPGRRHLRYLHGHRNWN